MTDNTHASRTSGRNAGSALNIGIGMLIGLIVALIVAYFAMSGGPFRDKANTNSLAPTTGSTDPNAPLYGNQTSGSAVATPSNDPAANEQGSGTGVLMSGQAPANAGLSQKPANTNDAAMADGNAASKPKKSDDPIGDLISNKTKPTSDNSAADGSKAAPKADTKTAVQPNSTTAPKTAPKPSNTDSPKAVTPVTAPGASNKNGSYTIQAGSFSDEQNAQKLKKQLATQGQLATVTKKQTSDGAIYRVRVGSYASAKDAQAANQKINGVVLDMTP